MADTKYSEITIAGKKYRLGGEADEAYLAQMGEYITKQYEAMREKASRSRLTQEQQQLMLHLNMADDYLQAEKRAAEAEARLEEMEQQIYELKHELVAAQIQREKEQNAKKQNNRKK